MGKQSLVSAYIIIEDEKGGNNLQKKAGKILILIAGFVVLWAAGSQTAKWMESRAVLQKDVSVEEPKDSKGSGSSQKKNTKKANDSSKDEEKKIALTFDDGPHPTYTEELLDGLKERGVKATFFVLGEHAQLHPDVVKRMKEEGHLIGNHTYSHMQLKDSNWDEYRKELITTNDVIREITGEDVVYVRPPYGSWDKSFEEELNMFPVLWSVDSRDWCSKDASGVVRRVVKDTEEGDIILMHDYYASTVTAALAVVDELQAEGYSFVTVEEILFD